MAITPDLLQHLDELILQLRQFRAGVLAYLLSGSGLKREPGQPTKSLPSVPRELRNDFSNVYDDLKEAGYQSEPLDEFRMFFMDVEKATAELQKVRRAITGEAAEDDDDFDEE